MNASDLFSELSFKASRSGGAGGQNVNKVSTKVELLFTIADSLILTDEQKLLLTDKLASKLSAEGILRVVSQSERTQLGNKKAALEKFQLMIEKCFEVRKIRRPTKVSKGAKERRLKTKKRDSEIKQSRRKDL